LYESIGKALEAMRVPRSIGKFAVACNDDVHGLDREEVKEVSLGVPDVLVQFQDVGNTCLELWCIESSFSQPRENAIWKLQRFADRSTHGVVAATLVDITESKRYSPPSDKSPTAVALANKTAATPAQRWQRKAKANRHLNSSSVVAYHHTWVSTLSFTITTWLCTPDGKLDLKDRRAQYYGHGVSHFPPSYSIDF
jgi:hypothetical protein